MGGEPNGVGPKIALLHASGMDVSTIADTLGMETQNVFVFLVPRLGKKLLTDPEDFMCPLTLEMMKNPVVAQDGFTYEEAAIKDVLRHDPRSPMTREAIGTRMILNRAIKSQIAQYKDQLVRQICDVAPQMMQLDVWLTTSLLIRAIDFLQPELPNPSAKRKLRGLLGMRLRLLIWLEAEQEDITIVATDLARLLANEEDCLQVMELCGEMSEASLRSLFLAAFDEARPPDVSESLGKALLQCVRDSSQVGLVWQVAELLSEIGQQPWTSLAAHALNTMLAAGHMFAGDLGQVRTNILKETAAVMKSPEPSLLQQFPSVLRNPEAACRHELGGRLMLELGKRGAIKHEEVLAEANGNMVEAAKTFIKLHRVDPTSKWAKEGC